MALLTLVLQKKLVPEIPVTKLRIILSQPRILFQPIVMSRFVECTSTFNKSKRSLFIYFIHFSTLHYYIYFQTLPEYDTMEKQDCMLSTTENIQERTEDDPTLPPTIPWGSLPKSRKRRATKSRRVKSKHKIMDSIADALKQVLVQGDTSENEFTIFGKHIATQLQCLPLEEAIKLQGEIQALVATTRLRCIQNANHTSFK